MAGYCECLCSRISKGGTTSREAAAKQWLLRSPNCLHSMFSSRWALSVPWETPSQICTWQMCIDNAGSYDAIASRSRRHHQDAQLHPCINPMEIDTQNKSRQPEHTLDVVMYSWHEMLVQMGIQCPLATPQPPQTMS